MKTFVFLYPTGRADVHYEGSFPSHYNRANCPDDPGFAGKHNWSKPWEARFSTDPGVIALASRLRLTERAFCGRCGCVRMTFVSREVA